MIRKPAVSGVFYPSRPQELKPLIEGFLERANIEKGVSENAVSFVAPHAGYIYSGQVAAYTYKAILWSNKKLGDCTFVIIGPNHSSYIESGVVSLSDWETPLGIVENDLQLSKEIATACSDFSTEDNYLSKEHSIEVQLPFLQSLFAKPRCAFICMSDQSLLNSRKVSNAILRAGSNLKRKVMVIASSDFDHFEPASVAEKKDMQAIKAITDLDPEKFHKILAETNDTACGYGPITAAMLFAKAKGAEKASLLKYANSGDVTKDYSSVVAYASISI